MTFGKTVIAGEGIVLPTTPLTGQTLAIDLEKQCPEFVIENQAQKRRGVQFPPVMVNCGALGDCCPSGFSRINMQ